MSYVIDPEGVEMAAMRPFLQKMHNARVLEIGCGAGRLTGLFAKTAVSLTAIDPDEEKVERAKRSLLPNLAAKTKFEAVDLDEFVPNGLYDWAVLSWSL